MRIDVIMLISGLDEEGLRLRQESVNSYASPETDVRLVMTRNAPPSVESQAEMELAAPGILERVVQSEREGADAVVIWGGHDPSLTAARELVQIPVLGPGMASMYLASLLAARFSLIVQLPGVVSIAKRQVHELGLETRCMGIYSVGLPVLEVRRSESFERVKETVVRSIEEGGADAVCFGCMGLNDHAQRLMDELSVSHSGVVVIHPGEAVIRLTELLVEMGVSHSKKSYPSPPKDVEFPV
jgi:allantoin racemase